MTAAIAIPLLALTGIGQITVLAVNAWALSGYICAIYVVSSLCYFLVHWAEPYVEELSHMSFAKYSLMGMWVWISLVNEVIPHVPSTDQLLSGALPLGTILISMVVIEAMAHIQRRAIAILIRLQQKDH